MTIAFPRNISAFIVALTSAALLGAAAPASGASITYSDPACAAFTITGSGGNFTLACSGQSGGGTPPGGGVQSGVPTGCSIAASPSSLPAGGGFVALTASCTGGDPVGGYSWTASPSTAGFPAVGSPMVFVGPVMGANITTTTAFTALPANSSGAGQSATTSVQVAAQGGGSGGGGGVAGGISCAAQGFSKTMSYTWDWNAGGGGGLTVQTSSDPQGPIGPNGIIVVAFTPTVTNYGSTGSVSIAPFGPGSINPTIQTTSISTVPCSLAEVFPWQHVGQDEGIPFTVGAVNPRVYPGLVAGTTYYVNIANRDAAGTSTCSASGSACDLRVQLNKPQ